MREFTNHRRRQIQFSVGRGLPPIARRVLLRDAAIGGAAAILVTLGDEARAAAADAAVPVTGQDIYCVFGYDLDSDTNFLTAVAPDGRQLWTADPFDARVVRVPGGDALLAITPVPSDSPHVDASLYDVQTGTTQSVEGRGVASGSELSYIFEVAVSPSGQQAAVLHQPAWMTNTRAVTKPGGNGDREIVVGTQPAHDSWSCST